MASDKCSKCYGIKTNPNSSYCKKCASEYYRIYRLNKKEPNINIDGLSDFIEKIIKSSYFIDFEDISTIIFFYQIITSDITEYDKYKSGRQIKLMWDRIYNFYSKKINKQKNI